MNDNKQGSGDDDDDDDCDLMRHECSGCPFFWLGKGPEKDRKGTTTKLVAQKSFLAVKFPFHKYQMSHVPFSTKWRHHGGKSLSAPHIFYV